MSKNLSSSKNLDTNLPVKNNRKRNKTIKNAIVAVVSVIFLVSGISCVYANDLMDQIGILPDVSLSGVSSSSSEESKPESTASSEDPLTGFAGLRSGLYHDDAITNVLLLGVDDYQESDVGRSDSMMMISLDKRHKKLKMTSFMRDMYVSIPGSSKGRINEAYSRGFTQAGEAGGGAMAVATVEANFGVDIDRFVLISNSAFDQIIDNLGGVEITLSAGEAREINKNAPDPTRKLTEGTYLLMGKQAHYYSRIRVIGDDFERTQRQRNVVESIVSKFKNSDIGTINKTLYDCLNLVKTNMAKNEILKIAGDALTYMNYPTEQLRVPGDNEFEAGNVNGAQVLIPYRKSCTESLVNFLFEGDIVLSEDGGDTGTSSKTSKNNFS